MGRGGGNDGGILAVKRYLIRTAAVDTSAAARAKVQAACRTRSCALSGEALMPPCVSDMLGRVYNKMAVCEYLLQAASGGKRPGFENLRSLSKDTFNLVLTRNDAGDAAPTRTGTKITAVSTTATDALFVCPVTQAPANGAIPFVALRKCGCAMSERALREIKGEACPACGAAFANADVVRLWPSEEELELARARLLAQKRERVAPVKIARALAPCAHEPAPTPSTAAPSVEAVDNAAGVAERGGAPAPAPVPAVAAGSVRVHELDRQPVAEHASAARAAAVHGAGDTNVAATAAAGDTDTAAAVRHARGTPSVVGAKRRAPGTLDDDGRSVRSTASKVPRTSMNAHGGTSRSDREESNLAFAHSVAAEAARAAADLSAKSAVYSSLFKKSEKYATGEAKTNLFIASGMGGSSARNRT